MAETNVTVERVTEFTFEGVDYLSNSTLLGLLIFTTYCLIVLGNSANICIIAADKRLHMPMYVFICNLAVIDITFTTSASLSLIALLLMGLRTISYSSCISQMFIYHLGDICLCLNLTLMAIDRVVAISRPLHYHSILTIRHTFALIAASWLLAVGIMGVLSGIVTGLPYCQPMLRYIICDYASLVRAACIDPEPYFIVTTVLSIWLIGGSLPMILASYVTIAFTVMKLSNNESRKQMINTCLSHVIVVTCYFVPKLVVILLTRVGVTLSLAERNILIIIATLVPSFLNPTVYCLRTKEIRGRLIKLLTRKAY